MEDPAPVVPAGRVESYEVRPIATSGQGGGQSDEVGNLYVAVGSTVKIFDTDQNQVGSIPVPQGAVDVAPAPDGASAFIVSKVGGRYLPQKYVKGADGSWSIDSSFKLEQFPYGGSMHDPEGMRIATDAHGNLFIADGTWTSNNMSMVIKYDADGKFITRFGSYVDGNPDEPSSWEQGRFYWALGGIAVSRDGNTVYTTEIGNNRVQRWDLQENGSYASTLMWGATAETDPNRTGSTEPGMFAAPYDVGIDQWGDVYVLNTTGAQIQKFTPDGEYLLSMDVGRRDDATIERSHGLAVDALGNAISTETGMVMRRTEAETREVPPMREAPKPDTTAPTISSVTLPASVDTPTAHVVLDVSDDRGAVQMRIADENGEWGAWEEFTPEFDAPLTDGPGVKGIYVQVRDAAENVSTAEYRTLLRTA